MKDTRKQREIAGIFLVGGTLAVLGAIYLKPAATKTLGVRLP